jgi:hypothetical protein
MSCNACDEPKAWKNGEKFYWKSQNQFSECVAKFCREGRNAGKPGPCPKDNSPEGGKSKASPKSAPKASKLKSQDSKDLKSLNKATKEYKGEIDKLEASKKPHQDAYANAVKKIDEIKYQADRSSSGMTPKRKADLEAAKGEQKKADAELAKIKGQQEKAGYRLSVVNENRQAILAKKKK